MDILALLRTARDKAASDVHLVASSPPLLRIDGSLQAVDGAAPLTGEEINQAFNQLTTPEHRPTSAKTWSSTSATTCLTSATCGATPPSNAGLSAWL
jgi:Tfp pilus assembly pilus retraction ATPase PilT